MKHPSERSSQWPLLGRNLGWGSLGPPVHSYCHTGYRSRSVSSKYLGTSSCIELSGWDGQDRGLAFTMLAQFDPGNLGNKGMK